MINIIVELSKSLMIALMLVSTFECFAVFNYTDEYTQKYFQKAECADVSASYDCISGDVSADK